MVIPSFDSIESIESIKIPNTEVMRSAANFWLAVAGVHTEKKQSLDAGVPAVEKSWQGRAGESYMQAIQKALLMGGMTQSQMLSVAKLLTSTAAQFDWGESLQAMAQRQWDAAKVLYGTGQVEAAALWLDSARATQRTAVDVIREAHANYDVSLKQLQAELPNKPVTPDGHAITFVKSGQPVAGVTMPASNGPVNPAIPPVTPPLTPPLGPTVGNKNAVNPATPPVTPPLTPPLGPTVGKGNPAGAAPGNVFLSPTQTSPKRPFFETPVSPASLTGEMSQSLLEHLYGEKTADIDLSLALVMQGYFMMQSQGPGAVLHHDPARLTSTQDTASLLFPAGGLAFGQMITTTTWTGPQVSSVQSPAPPAPRERRSRPMIGMHGNVELQARELARWERKDPRNPLTRALLSTPEGRFALDIDREYQVRRRWLAGQGSSCNPSTNTVTLDQQVPFARMQKDAIHEAIHVWFARTGQTADPRKLSQAAYVERLLWEESVAEVFAIRHYWRVNPTGPFSPLDQIYIQGYQQGYAVASSGGYSLAEREQVGNLFGLLRVFEAFRRGDVVHSISTADEGAETFVQYYQREWSKQKGRGAGAWEGLRPAPLRPLNAEVGSDGSGPAAVEQEGPSSKVLKKASSALVLFNAMTDAIVRQRPLSHDPRMPSKSYLGSLPRVAGLSALGGGMFGASYYAVNIVKSGLNDKNAAGLMGNALFFREGQLLLLSLGSRTAHDIHHAHIHVGKVGAAADALKAYSALREENYKDAITYGLLGYGNLRSSLENKDLVHSYRNVLKFLGRSQAERANLRTAITLTRFLYQRVLGVKHPIILATGAAFGVAGKLWPQANESKVSELSRHIAPAPSRGTRQAFQELPSKREPDVKSAVPTGKRPLGDLSSLTWIQAFPFLKVMATDKVGYKAVYNLKEYPDLKVEWGWKGYGSYYASSTITLDSALSQQEAEETFVHESNHALLHKTGKSVSGKVRELKEEEFVDGMIKEEVASQILTIKYNISRSMQSGVRRPPAALQKRYEEAFRQEVKKRLRTASHMKLAQAGERAGALAVYRSLKDGDAVASGTFETYTEVYSKWWKDYHPVP